MLQLLKKLQGDIILDNKQTNGINNADSPMTEMTEELDEIIKAAENAAEKSMAENAADEAFEVQALPENEAMMVYCEVSSDMPSIGSEPSV